PVAYVQLRPNAHADAAELLAFVASRTPERAANPVQVHVLDAIPLTRVGKVFKPALRGDAARRRATETPPDLPVAAGTLEVTVANHATHGSLITVHVKDVPAAARATLETEVHRRLDPLVTRHEILWG